MEMTAVTRVVSPTAVSTDIEGFSVATEPPVSNGGSGVYPPATRLVVAALLNCIFSAVKTFCDKRSIATEGMEMRFAGNFEDGLFENMRLLIRLNKEFPRKYHASLAKIIDTCSVGRIIKNLPCITLSIEE